MIKISRFSFVIIYVLLLAGCTKVGTGTSDMESGGGRSSYEAGDIGGSSGGGGGTGGGGNPNPAGVITAGEWNDLDNWSFWMGLMDTITWKENRGIGNYILIIAFLYN